MPQLRRLLAVTVAVFLTTTTLATSTPVELAVTSHPPASLRLPPAARIDGDGGGGPFCTRVYLQGRPSRLRDPSRFFHALRVRANASRPNALELCFHNNATVGPCNCTASQWQKMPKTGLWVQAVSPYDQRILDFRMLADPSRSIVVSTEEEFLLHRVVFMVLGMILMAVADMLSECVVLYYGGAMTIGIVLMILIILFQGMKLLPTGKKSTLAIVAYSSLAGMTTIFVTYLSGFLRSMLVEIGISEDMHNPIGIFILVCVILAGAWFGYWGVRKLVLTEEGNIDAGVAYFVKWAIIIISSVMIFQSSLDPLFASIALSFCIIMKTVLSIEGKSAFVCHLSRGLTLGEDYSSINEARQDGSSKLHCELRRRTPKRKSPLAGSSGKTMSQGLARDNYYSTFHNTPERRKFTKEEYEAFTREETKKAMRQLLSSPDFNRWALANADRISVTPPGSQYNSNSQQQHRFFGWF